jgi:hypothetical protein
MSVQAYNERACLLVYSIIFFRLFNFFFWKLDREMYNERACMLVRVGFRKAKQ